MQKPEIIGGLKRAIERGYSLEKAKISLVNSGYNIEDVEDSARLLFGFSIPEKPKPVLQQIQTSQPPQQQYQPQQPPQQAYQPPQLSQQLQQQYQPQPQAYQPQLQQMPQQQYQSPQIQQPQFLPSQLPQYQQQAYQPQQATRERNLGRKILIIILIIIFLLSLAGLISLLVFQEKSISIINKIPYFNKLLT